MIYKLKYSQSVLKTNMQQIEICKIIMSAKTVFVGEVDVDFEVWILKTNPTH